MSKDWHNWCRKYIFSQQWDSLPFHVQTHQNCSWVMSLSSVINNNSNSTNFYETNNCAVRSHICQYRYPDNSQLTYRQVSCELTGQWHGYTPMEGYNQIEIVPACMVGWADPQRWHSCERDPDKSLYSRVPVNSYRIPTFDNQSTLCLIWLTLCLTWLAPCLTWLALCLTWLAPCLIWYIPFLTQLTPCLSWPTSCLTQCTPCLTRPTSCLRLTWSICV